MAGYRPFPIYDFRTGFYKYREPWLSPPDAFKSIVNGCIYHGVLQKRSGDTEFGRLCHAVEGEVIGTGDAGGTVTFAADLAETPLKPGSITVTDGVETFTDNGDGTLTGDAGGTGTYTVATGAISVTFDAAPGDGIDVECDYSFYPGLAVMGITEYYESTLTKKLLALDTKRVNQWNSTTEEFEDISGTDTFTGADYNFFRFCNTIDNVLYITNGIDQIRTYDGTTIAALSIDYDDDSNNDINTCKMIFEYKGHLVLLAPTEKNTYRGQRARYSAAADYSDFPNAFYNDCPTFDEIEAGIIADELIVWFKYSVWS